LGFGFWAIRHKPKTQNPNPQSPIPMLYLFYNFKKNYKIK